MEALGRVRDWTGWLRQFAISATLIGVAVAVGLLVIDPYDSGRPLSPPIPGTTLESPRFGHVGRARQPRFEAAILGNSHVQLLSPARLGALTGVPFVSLTVPGAGVREKLAILRWFLAHRRQDPAVIVVGIDEFECTPGAAVPQTNPFPFWVYERRLADYLAGLFRIESLGDGFAKLAAAVRGRLKAPDDGYWDYEAGRQWADPRLPVVPASVGAAPPAPHDAPAFGGLELLLKGLAEVPASTTLVFVLPPVHASQRPASDGAARHAEAACKEALGRFVGTRARSHVVDFRTDHPDWQRSDLFWDASHYRRPVAEAIERRVASKVTGTAID